MSNLPKLDLPYFSHTLVGLGKKIKYRPFTMKEQKILLHAKESEDPQDHVDAIKQIIELCTDGKFEVEDLPFFDIEDLFVRIRSKSVGEMCEINYRVKDSETNEKVTVQINLDDIRVTTPEDHDKKVMITDEVGLMMKYPSLELLNSDNQEDNEQHEDRLIRQCIDYVFDSEEVYHFNDFSDKEVEEWMDQFDVGVMKKIYHFFETMPRIRHEVEVELKDGSKETIKFEGINDLFT